MLIIEVASLVLEVKLNFYVASVRLLFGSSFFFVVIIKIRFDG